MPEGQKMRGLANGLGARVVVALVLWAVVASVISATVGSGELQEVALRVLLGVTSFLVGLAVAFFIYGGRRDGEEPRRRIRLWR